MRSAGRSDYERSLVDWRRPGYEICPNKPPNAACLGHRARFGHWPGQIADIDARMRHLRDRARRLLTASGRSDVPPFMVMDVMAAAARIEAAGGHVIHMEVGQPAASAPKAAIAAAHAALDAGRIDYTSALGIPSLRAAHRAALPRYLRLHCRCRARSWSPRARRARSSWPFWRCSSRATASR